MKRQRRDITRRRTRNGDAIASPYMTFIMKAIIVKINDNHWDDNHQNKTPRGSVRIHGKNIKIGRCTRVRDLSAPPKNFFLT